jgi:GntR family transcriptional regulator, transcriptional repressor for pyruvate dehydrogenase complex
VAVTDEAIGRIKDMIVSGALRPGDRLPRESELAAALGLSRNSLREAVRALALIRILEVRQGDGTYVSSLGPRLLAEVLGLVMEFHGAGRDGTAQEVLAVRRVLEPAATALAAARIDGEALDALTGLLDGLGPEPTEGELASAERAFHREIARWTGNAVLGALLDGLFGPPGRVPPDRERRPAPRSAVERTAAEHRAIVGAMRAGDAEAARSWALVHVAGEVRESREPGRTREPPEACGAPGA